MTDADVVRKPSWDGRQEFVTLLMRRFEAAGDCLSNEEYADAWQQFSRLYAQALPRIDKKEAQSIKELLSRIERRLPRENVNALFFVKNDRWLKRELHTVEQELATATKHLMLSDNNESDDTLKWDDD